MTNVEAFTTTHFCASRRYCNRCRNKNDVRDAIWEKHGIDSGGSGCPLSLAWDTPSDKLPITSRWECPSEPEHAVWVCAVTHRVAQITSDNAYEQQQGRLALLARKNSEQRITPREAQELNLLKGGSPNTCRLRQQTSCGCSGGGWVICHAPGFAASGLSDKGMYNPMWVRLEKNAREAVPEDLRKMVGTEPNALARAEFRQALNTACREHGGCVPEHQADCDMCWERSRLIPRQVREQQ